MEVFVRTLFNELARRQRVILPGLGTLRIVRIPAETTLSGEISNPYTTVQFTVKEEEGETLPELIARCSGVPIKDIKPRYNRWISRLTVEAGQGAFVIAGVLSLIPESDGSFRVQTDKRLDELLNPMGQRKIQFSVLSSSHTDTPSANPKTPASGTESVSSGHPRKSSGKNRRNLWGSILIILVGGGALGYYGYTENWFSPEPENTRPVGLTEETVESDPEPVVLPDTVPADTIPTLPSPSAPPTPAEPPTINLSTGDVYHVIAGVFSTRENAERYIREKNFESTRTTIIPTAQGQFMVSAGKFPDKASADAEMARLQKDIPEVWISKRKK